MERTMTVEEKIRRAEEIYARRQAGSSTKTATVNINTNTKKDLNHVQVLRERETGFEPAALALARRCSTTEPLAHIKFYGIKLNESG